MSEANDLANLRRRIEELPDAWRDFGVVLQALISAAPFSEAERSRMRKAVTALLLDLKGRVE